MDNISSPRGQGRASRSRNGCSTCRAARVRCDETQPACNRCCRLGLSCDWSRPPSLAARRRGYVSLDSRPREILPNAIQLSAYGISDSDGYFPAIASESSYTDTSQLEFDSSSKSDWLLDMLQDPMLLFNQVSAADSLMPQCDPFSPSSNFSLGMGFSDMVATQVEPQNDSTGVINPDTTMFELARGVHPLPGLLAQFSAFPTSMDLSPQEHYALYYYRTTLSLSHTTKDPMWSTSMVLLRLGSKRPLVMHLLLASSLKSIVSNREVDDVSEALVIAKHRFESGEKLLDGELKNEVDPDHVNVMAAFWFLYLYRSRQSNLDMGEMTRLSQRVGGYVRKHGLDRLCTAPAIESPSGDRLGLSRQKRSLLARLLIWIFYADVSFGFRHRGGSLAKYLSEDISRTDKVYKTSKAILHLHWGKEYPAHQVSDDVKNSEVLEMLYRSFMVYQAVNELSDSIPIEGQLNEEIERRLTDIEENHSPIFVLANSTIRGCSRLWQNADWVACLFYAIRIYHFRSTKNPDPHATARPPIVEKALSSLIGIAYRTYASGPSELHRCPQWPLLIAGAETSDPIHRDWILQHMSPEMYKSALQDIVEAQRQAGGRIGMSHFRRLCNDVGGSEDGAGAQRGNVQRIGFGAWC